MKLQNNSPVVLAFTGASLLALILDFFTSGASTTLVFSVYRSSFTNPLTYVRMFMHVLGHSSYSHFMSNILMILVVGPSLEEKYGSNRLLLSIVVTAVVTGLFHMLAFNSVLLGASGIVFMMIMLSSFSGFESGHIPITMILLILLYLGKEVVDVFDSADNISQTIHILGGVCGLVMGWIFNSESVNG